MERMEFTAVCYLIKRVMIRAHTLECTEKVLVSGTCILALMLQRDKFSVSNRKSI